MVVTPAPTTEASVIPLLRDLVPNYVRRVSPGGQGDPTSPDRTPPADEPEPVDFVSCSAIDGVVTIDNERRIAWPTGAPQPEAAVIRAVGEHIELSIAADRGPSRSIDCRGRLRLPAGVLHATGLRPGDRVLVARSDTGWVLAPAHRIVVRLATA
jgi:hypothetical protein